MNESTPQITPTTAIIKQRFKWSDTAGYITTFHVWIKGKHRHEMCGWDYIETKARVIAAGYNPKLIKGKTP